MLPEDDARLKLDAGCDGVVGRIIRVWGIEWIDRIAVGRC